MLIIIIMQDLGKLLNFIKGEGNTEVEVLLC